MIIDDETFSIQRPLKKKQIVSKNIRYYIILVKEDMFFKMYFVVCCCYCSREDSLKVENIRRSKQLKKK